MAKKYILGLYDDEVTLIDAVKKIRSEGIHIHDVLTPFPVHGLESAMGLKESRLHITGFLYGMTGTAIAFSFMTWAFTRNWPLNIGGKPYFSFPAFIPIMFEFTVLCAAVGMAITWLIRCGMYPGKIREPLDPRTTDNLFGIVFNPDRKTTPETANRMLQVLRDTGAVEVKERDLARKY
jgi:hypothetical protein